MADVRVAGCRTVHSLYRSATPFETSWRSLTPKEEWEMKTLCHIGDVRINKASNLKYNYGTAEYWRRMIV